jgi:alkylhydroperoxidase/carboxymuconolactone decarboxylase family protein YurZ
VEEVLHLGATAAEIAETLDVGAIMGGTVSMKSVRHAFAIMDEITGKGSAR